MLSLSGAWAELAFEIACAGCGASLYRGGDLKSARDLVRMANGRCHGCGQPLSSQDFTLEVLRIGNA
jgi:hypothetical protein